MAFHGGGGGGWGSIRYQAKLTQKADSVGFIVVYPEGRKTTGTSYRGWNAGECCYPSSTDSVDDVEFVNVMLDTLISRYHVDQKRIYAAGSSNGAMFCLRLACELSERITAIAVNAGSQTFPDCHPIRAVPIINFHSTIDSTVSYFGGVGTESVIYGVNFISQDSLMNVWQSLNECSHRDTVVNGGDSSYTLIRISDCGCSWSFMDFYTTTDGGHSWPGGKPNVDPASTQVSATVQMWKFFLQHVIHCENPKLGISNPADNNFFTVFPNPVQGNEFEIELFNPSGKNYLSIYDLTGRKLLEKKLSNDFSEKIYFPAPTGMYLLQVKTDFGTTTMKLAVQ